MSFSWIGPALGAVGSIMGRDKQQREDPLARAKATQINQNTPWGSVTYSGAVGSPDRTQTVTLNPQDQHRLDQKRRLAASLLGGASKYAQASGLGMGLPEDYPAADATAAPAAPPGETIDVTGNPLEDDQSGLGEGQWVGHEFYRSTPDNRRYRWDWRSNKWVLAPATATPGDAAMFGYDGSMADMSYDPDMGMSQPDALGRGGLMDAIDSMTGGGLSDMSGDWGGGDYDSDAADSGLGYRMGGFTGLGDDRMLQPSEPAGVVHEGEFVFSAPAVKEIGVGALRQAHDTAKNGGRYKGLAMTMKPRGGKRPMHKLMIGPG